MVIYKLKHEMLVIKRYAVYNMTLLPLSNGSICSRAAETNHRRVLACPFFWVHGQTLKESLYLMIKVMTLK